MKITHALFLVGVLGVLAIGIHEDTRTGHTAETLTTLLIIAAITITTALTVGATYWLLTTAEKRWPGYFDQRFAPRTNTNNPFTTNHEDPP